MTLHDLLNQYEVDFDHRIVSPGKFEGEPLFVPYFWEAVLMGESDWTDDNYSTLTITDEDRAMFPELGEAHTILMHETENGFVLHTLFYGNEVA